MIAKIDGQSFIPQALCVGTAAVGWASITPLTQPVFDRCSSSLCPWSSLLIKTVICIGTYKIAEAILHRVFRSEKSCQIGYLSNRKYRLSDEDEKLILQMAEAIHQMGLPAAESDDLSMPKVGLEIDINQYKRCLEALSVRTQKRIERRYPATSVGHRYVQIGIAGSLIKLARVLKPSLQIKAFEKILFSRNFKQILEVIPSDQCQSVVEAILTYFASSRSWNKNINDAKERLSTCGLTPDSRLDYYALLLTDVLLKSEPALLPNSWVRRYFQAVFYWPEHFKFIIDNRFRLESLDISDGGNGIGSWVNTVEAFLKKMRSSEGSTAFADAYKEATEASNPTPRSLLLPQLIEGWVFERVLGRTLLFKRNGIYRAIKLQRATESVDALWREHNIITLLTSERGKLLFSEECPDGFMTKWPTPVEVCHIKELPLNLQAHIKMPIAVKDRSLYAYVYEFPNDHYFRYLHDPTLKVEEFTWARKAMLHDLFALARHGIVYTALADLFHNLEFRVERGDEGQYLPLVDLFKIQVGRMGAGRLMGIWGAVEYPNARASGLADPDTHLISNLMANLSETPLREREQKGVDGLEHYLFAHFFSCYLLVDQLIMGRRAFSTMNWQDEEYVNELGKQMANGMGMALAAFTNLPLDTVENFVQKGGLDWKKLARQMCFWMRNDSQGYVPHIKAGRIPQSIFEDVTCTMANSKDLRGWSDSHGFMLKDGVPDSGPVNGQHLIKEGERSWYVMALFSQVMKDEVAKAKKWRKRAKQSENVDEKMFCIKKIVQHRPDQIRRP